MFPNVEVGRRMTGLSAESRARVLEDLVSVKLPKVKVFVHSTVVFKDLKIRGAKIVVNTEV